MVYSLVALGAVVLEFVDRDVPTYPGVFVAIPPAIFIFLLYLGLYRWSGPGPALLWMFMPAGCVCVAIWLANATDGDVVIPAAGTVAAFVITVVFAEWLRRHPRVDANAYAIDATCESRDS
jgi:ABC-type arginine/histidine transport system permease subunit